MDFNGRFSSKALLPLADINNNNYNNNNNDDEDEDYSLDLNFQSQHHSEPKFAWRFNYNDGDSHDEDGGSEVSHSIQRYLSDGSGPMFIVSLADEAPAFPFNPGPESYTAHVDDPAYSELSSDFLTPSYPPPTETESTASDGCYPEFEHRSHGFGLGASSAHHAYLFVDHADPISSSPSCDKDQLFFFQASDFVAPHDVENHLDGNGDPPAESIQHDNNYQHQPQHHHNISTPAPAAVPKPQLNRTPPERKYRRIRGSSNKRRSTRSKTNSKRPFHCSFYFAGCKDSFVSKNEWKRHVLAQHMQLTIWRCDMPTCADRKSSIFIRKDLFSQHLKRMHAPKQDLSAKRPTSPWLLTELPKILLRCMHPWRQPPTSSTCGFCHKSFAGENSWKDRMEHVGRHYERSHHECVDPDRWVLDRDFVNWACHHGIVLEYEPGKWKLASFGKSAVVAQ